MTEIIQSGSNPRVKELVKLRESPRKRRERNACVVEGAEDVLQFIKSGKEILEIYYCSERVSQRKSVHLLELWEKENYTLQPLGIDAFQKASYRNHSDGVLAVVRTWSLKLDPEFKSEKELVLVLDEVEKPGNLGAILRTSEALGVNLVLLSDPCVDFFNPNVIRSSRGLIAEVAVRSGTKQEVLEWMTNNDLKIFGSSSKINEPIYKQNYTLGTAFVMGNEKQGLGAFWKERLSQWCTIPMLGAASSLNLNASVACLVSEFNRSNCRH